MTPSKIPVALLVFAAATLLACGDEDKGGTTTSNSTTGATATGKKLNDCAYAAALLTSLETYSTTVPSVTSYGNKETALTAFDSFDAALGSLVSDLTSYQLSADVAKLNRNVIAIFEDARRQIPELKGAVESGDTTRLNTVSVTLSQVIVPQMEAIQQQNPGATAKLNQCDRA